MVLRSLIVISTLALASQAGAVVIANTDFSTGSLAGLSFDDTTAGYGTTGPDGSRAISLVDTLGTQASVARYTPPSSNPFNTASAGQSELNLSFDFAVTKLSATTANANSIPRLILRNGTSAAQGLTIAFGRSTAGELVLYAAKGDAVTPATAGALTHVFDSYNETDSTLNGTGGYVHFAISLVHGGTSIQVTATQGADTLFTGLITGYSGHSWANTNTGLVMATGSAGTGEMYIDNLVFQTVPEPGSLILSASAFGLFAFRRTRRK